MSGSTVGVGATPTRNVAAPSGTSPTASPPSSGSDAAPPEPVEAPLPPPSPTGAPVTDSYGGPIGGPIADMQRKLAGRHPDDGVIGGPLGQLLDKPVGGPLGRLAQQPAPPAGGSDPLSDDEGIKRGRPMPRIGVSHARGEKGYDSPPQDLARAANEKYAKPPATHPYRQHIEGVHERLQKKGLPTSAEGVRVRVTGEDLAHGGSVTRSVTGPVGIAPGADIGLQLRRDLEAPSPSFKMTAAESGRLQEARSRQERVQAGNATLDDAAQLGVDFGEEMLQTKRRELAEVVDGLPQPSDGKPTLVNMSQNMSPVRMGARAASEILSAPPGSPLRKEAAEALGKDSINLFDTEKLTTLMTERVAARMQSPEGKAQLADGKRHLERDLAAAREKGVLVFTSTSNDYANAMELTGNPRHSIALTDDVKGLVRVGATDIGNDPRSASDDSVATFTSDGRNVTLAAPGHDIPVGDEAFDAMPFGKRQPRSLGGMFGGMMPQLGAPPPKPAKPQPIDINGTSFATPYTVGTAALMVKSNPSLTPDAIEQILRDPRVTTDIKDSRRDGAGALDPVKAVELARAWRP